MVLKEVEKKLVFIIFKKSTCSHTLYNNEVFMREMTRFCWNYYRKKWWRYRKTKVVKIIEAGKWVYISTLLYSLFLGLEFENKLNYASKLFLNNLVIFQPETLLLPREHLTINKDISGCHNSGEGCCYWYLQAKARDSAKYPILHKTALHNEGLSSSKSH